MNNSQTNLVMNFMVNIVDLNSALLSLMQMNVSISDDNFLQKMKMKMNKVTFGKKKIRKAHQ